MAKVLNVVMSQDVWDAVLDAVGLSGDIDEPLVSTVIRLEVGEPVMVTHEKYAVRDSESS